MSDEKEQESIQDILLQKKRAEFRELGLLAAAKIQDLINILNRGQEFHLATILSYGAALSNNQRQDLLERLATHVKLLFEIAKTDAEIAFRVKQAAIEAEKETGEWEDEIIIPDEDDKVN